MLHVLVSHSGQILDPDTPLLHADDLRVLHGDGLFETMLVRDGRVRGPSDISIGSRPVPPQPACRPSTPGTSRSWSVSRAVSGSGGPTARAR